jgi:integrase/recombinase XerD
MKVITKTNQDHSIIRAGYKGLSKATQQAYKRDLQTFNDIVNKDIQNVKPDDILNYIQELKNREYKNATINRKIYSLSKIFKLYVMQGLCKVNPISQLNQIKRITKPVENQISAIHLEIADIQNATRIKNKTTLFIKALSQTGCRISELINIKCGDITDISLDGKAYKEITINGKGDKQRKVFLTGELYRDIKNIYGKSKAGYLFQSKSGKVLSRHNLYIQIRRAFIKSTGKRINPHMIRHFFAGQKIQVEKKDLKSISTYLGHSSISTTGNMYLKSVLNPAELVLSV